MWMAADHRSARGPLVWCHRQGSAQELEGLRLRSQCRKYPPRRWSRRPVLC